MSWARCAVSKGDITFDEPRNVHVSPVRPLERISLPEQHIRMKICNEQVGMQRPGSLANGSRCTRRDGVALALNNDGSKRKECRG